VEVLNIFEELGFNEAEANDLMKRTMLVSSIIKASKNPKCLSALNERLESEELQDLLRGDISKFSVSWLVNLIVDILP